MMKLCIIVRLKGLKNKGIQCIKQEENSLIISIPLSTMLPQYIDNKRVLFYVYQPFNN